MTTRRKTTLTSSFRNDRGVAVLELSLILPVLLVMVFAIIDFGLLTHARLIIANIAREGGNLASRDIKAGNDLIKMLQTSANPLKMQQDGRICISSIVAGTLKNHNPAISGMDPQVCVGSLAASSRISAGATNLGLTQKVYDHLVFKQGNYASDIYGVTVVETYYKYKPITPLPKFITNILLNDGDGMIIGSRAVFCTTGE
jgi:Flp pilus assembly protein TadG